MTDAPTTLPPGLPDGLVESHRAWVEAVDGTDLDAYAALVCEDAVWMPPGEEAVEGREAFREWLAPFFAEWRYDFTVVDPRFRVAAGRAMERGRFVTRLTARTGSEQIEHVAHFVLLWREDEDGTWRIERYVDDR